MEILRQMAKYQIYGIGAALVDTEVVVSDEFLKLNAIEKGEPTVSMGAYLNVISALDLNLHLSAKGDIGYETNRDRVGHLPVLVSR